MPSLVGTWHMNHNDYEGDFVRDAVDCRDHMMGRTSFSGEPTIQAVGSWDECDQKAAKTFFRKLLKGYQYIPRVIITDTLKSYEAAKRELLTGVEHRQYRHLNNRAENSHQPTRQRKRRMQRVNSPEQAQYFLPASGAIGQHFRPRRDLLIAPKCRQEMRQRFRAWQERTHLSSDA
jgi:putative transposase